jgi:hypothetical protein
LEAEAMPIIGIDLGTSNSAGAVLRGGRPVIIRSAEGISLGGKAFSSYVAVAPDGQIIVGEPARRQRVVNPESTTSGFKRLMGQRDRVRLGGKEFSPEELSALLLQKIKRDAEAFLGSRRRSSPCRPTSMTTSAARPRTLAASRASKRPGSSTSLPRPRLPTASIGSARTCALSSSTLAAARAMKDAVGSR